VVGPYALLVDMVACTVAITSVATDSWLATFSFGDTFSASPSPLTASPPSAALAVDAPPPGPPPSAPGKEGGGGGGGGARSIAVFGNTNWLVLASSTTVAVWDWEPILLQKNMRAAPVPPSRIVRLVTQLPNPNTDELDVVLEPSSNLCSVDARCRVLLGSPRSLLVFDVAKNQELFRYAMSLHAPSVGPFYRVAWQRDTLCTLEHRGARFWSLKHKLDRPVAPLIAPDVQSAPFTTADFVDKTALVLGDALGRLRIIKLADVPPMLSQASWIEAQRVRTLSSAGLTTSTDDPASSTSSDAPASLDVYSAMPTGQQTADLAASARLLAGDLGVFAELIKSSTLAMLKAAVKRKLPNQLADLRALRDGRQRTALHVAAERNRIEIATYLIRKSDLKFLNTCDVSGRSPLHLAALSHACEICRQLLHAGARASQRDMRGSTALHALVQQPWPKASVTRDSLMNVSEALRGVLAPDEPGRNRALAQIMDAIANDQPTCELVATALLRATVPELRALTGDKTTPNDGEESEADASTRRPSFAGPLASAPSSENLYSTPGDEKSDETALPSLTACFAALLGINARDCDDSTPLMTACFSDNVDAVRTLLHLGADLKVQRADGDTALHIAVRRAAADTTRVLLQAGASPNTVNRAGESSWALAGRSGSEAVLAVLSKMRPPASDSMGTIGGGSGEDDDEESSTMSMTSAVAASNRKLMLSKNSSTRITLAPSSAASAAAGSPAVSSVPSSPSLTTLSVGAAAGAGAGASASSPLLSSSPAAAAVVASALASAAPGSPAAKGSGSTLRSRLARLARGGSDVASSELQTAWFTAASTGSIETLKDLLKKIGASAFLLRDKHDQTALHRAAFKGHTSAVVWLLSNKKAPQLYVHATDKNGWTALHGAASAGNIETCAVLLDGGADPTRPSLTEHGGTTPLHYAARMKWKAPALPTLLGRMLDSPNNSTPNPLEARDQRRATPLLSACWKGTRESVAFLLGRKAAINAVDSAGEGVLHYAARGNQAASIELLLQRGADPTATNSANQTALDVASSTGTNEARAVLAEVVRVKNVSASPVSKLVGAAAAAAAGAGGGKRGSANTDSDGSEDSGRSAMTVSTLSSTATAAAKAAHAALAREMAPLFDAVSKGNLAQVRTLIKANPTRAFEASTLEQGRTVLHLAVEGGHLEVLTWLLGYKRRPTSVVHRVDASGLTPLHLATSVDGREKMSRLLVRCGSDAFMPAGSRRSTPLHELASTKWLGEESAALLDDVLGVSKADAEAANKNIEATLLRADSLATSAAEATAPPTSLTTAGTPAAKKVAVAPIFIDPRNMLGMTPLMAAAAAGRSEACAYLVSRGARIDCVDMLGDSLMHHAVRSGKPEVVRVLLACNVPFKSRGARDTPLALATEKNLPAIVQLLQRAAALEAEARRRATRSSFRVLPTSDLPNAGGARKRPSSRSTLLDMAERAVSVKTVEYATTSAPSALLHGSEVPLGTDAGAATIERIVVSNGRIFVAQRGGSLSVWDAGKRGAWQPLAATVCNANAVVAMEELEGAIVALFAQTATLEERFGGLGDSNNSVSSRKSANGLSPLGSALPAPPPPLSARSRASRYLGDAPSAVTQSFDTDSAPCSRLVLLSVRADFQPRSTQERILAGDIVRMKEIGRGAFGTVWYGEWRGRPVAIKEARATATSDHDAGNAALVDEANRLSALPPHSNVLRLYGTCTGPPLCIVTEYCSHGSLNALLYGENPDPNMVDSTVDRCVVDAALGLYHLHANGVVHRDIAARNILVDENYRAKVADFGMARAADDEGDYTTSTSGPLKWMSPEQLERRKFSYRSDVWAFGCLMYECYARRKPWDGYTNAAAVHKVLSAQRMAPPKTAPPIIAELMRRCWHSKPNKRPTMADICTTLSKAVAAVDSLDDASVATDYGDLLQAYPNLTGGDPDDDDDALTSPPGAAALSPRPALPVAKKS
jgi:ankyrin repeat protein/predicted Ser/Thr protein kinase